MCVLPLESEHVIYVPCGYVRQSSSNPQVFISSPATPNIATPVPTVVGNAETQPQTPMDISSSPIKIVEPPHHVCPSTLTYVIKDSTMGLVSASDLASNIIHVLPPINSYSNPPIFRPLLPIDIRCRSGLRLKVSLLSPL